MCYELFIHASKAILTPFELLCSSFATHRGTYMRKLASPLFRSFRCASFHVHNTKPSMNLFANPFFMQGLISIKDILPVSFFDSLIITFSSVYLKTDEKQLPTLIGW